MKVKIESFAIIANAGTAKEVVIATFQVKNDDMNTAGPITVADLGELLHRLADGASVTAVSIGTTEEMDDADAELVAARLLKTFGGASVL